MTGNCISMVPGKFTHYGHFTRTLPINYQILNFNLRLQNTLGVRLRISAIRDLTINRTATRRQRLKTKSN